MLKPFYPCLLAGNPIDGSSQLDVTDKFTGEKITSVGLADEKMIDQAIAAAVRAAPALAQMPVFERQEILRHCVREFEKRREELAQVLCAEAGKPIKDSRGEVTRLIDTFQIASEEAGRIYGEITPLDITPRAKGYFGMWKRVPVGPCSFISPFNFPLNLAAHKIAPAIAAGCPFILKPASKTPMGALMIGEVLAQTALPKGAFSILPCSRNGADLFATDERLKLLSFTGSPSVGWELKKKAGKKKVVLELGGNAGVIVDQDTNVEDAVGRILIGAFYQSGQSCISVQRILVHEKIYDAFKTKLIAGAKTLKTGNPKDESTFVGPLIDESEADRLEKWINQAKQNGATILCGGSRKGALLEPTLLENVKPSEPLCAQEAFGPVAVLSKFSDFDKALDEINQSDFGLQAGIFTKDIYKAHRAWDKLEVGGVVVGDVPSWRGDNMPYGGVKDSGLGREGIRFAIEDMTEMRMFVLRTP